MHYSCPIQVLLTTFCMLTNDNVSVHSLTTKSFMITVIQCPSVNLWVIIEYVHTACFSFVGPGDAGAAALSRRTGGYPAPV